MTARIDVWRDESRQFIRQTIVGDMDAADFKRLDDLTIEAAKQLVDPRRVQILFDASKSGRPSVEARRAAMETLRRPTFERMAVFGASPLTRTVLRLAITIAGKDSIRVFRSERDAVAWLTGGARGAAR